MEKNGVLDDILNSLKRIKKDSFFRYNIKEIFLNAPYTIVELENGDQGISANYDYIDHRKDGPVWDKISENKVLSKELMEKSKEDRLLYKTILVKDVKDDLTLQSLRVAILSALSRGTEDYLESQGIKIRGHDDFHINNISTPGDSILFIGFGGNILKALKSKNFENIYVSDCKYIYRKLKMAKYLKIAFPDKNLSFIDPTHNAEILKNTDVVWITASSMSNGTVDELIDGAANCREVIFQGATGAVFPMPLFEKKVTRVLCPNINFDFMSSAKTFIEEKDTEEYFREFPGFVDDTITDMYMHL